ncbi:ABC transporter permease [Afifella pfennigii]|uniref:ABC transporter permease n=1 Tax=Afifella pfennigii TaxID=209897 RepID=UPI00068E1C0C|nr:ABC transporter permease [Afifella pfennigii]
MSQEATVAVSPGTEKKRQVKKPRGEPLLERFSALILAAFILLVWQVSVPLSGISEFVLPTPWAIASRIVTDFPLLISNAYVTLFEVLAGFGSAAVIGVPTALAIFYWRPVERAVYPLLIALQTIPKVALAPILVLYLGYGWAPKITLAFLIAFFPIVVATVVGLQSLDKGLVNLVRSMGASEWQTFTKIRLPAALPNIFGGFKVAISLSVIGAVIGEYVAAEQGLGYLQLLANSQFDTTLNFATVVMISGLGVMLYFILTFVEKKVTFHRESAK